MALIELCFCGLLQGTEPLLEISSVGDLAEVAVGLDGDVSDLRLWGVERAEMEIREGMRRRLNGSEQALLGYWPVNSPCTNINSSEPQTTTPLYHLT